MKHFAPVNKTGATLPVLKNDDMLTSLIIMLQCSETDGVSTPHSFSVL